ncbi:MAG: hypothetical protein K0B00_13730 [Rhodobacteraceae bacterium]|nr:hypothetical protein [Paracoccaceae bacterium]
MKRLTTLTAILALSAGMAAAQVAFVPGAEFLTAWDLDGDGKVTLEEARERRDSIFYMFDLNGDDQYSADEIAGIDAHKAEEAANGKGVGQRGGGQMRGQAGQIGQGIAQAPNAAVLPGQGGMGRGQAGHQGQGFAQAPVGAGAAIQPGQGRGMGRGAGRGQMMQTGLHQPGAMQPGAGRGQMLGQAQALGQAPVQPGAMQPGAGRGQMQGQGFAAVTGAQGSTAAALAGTATELLGFDTDGNGIITRAEFVDGTPVWFAQRDRNGDGVITSADFGNGRF